MWLQLSVLSSVSCFLPFAICNVRGASSESEGLHGRWWPLGELVCGGLVSGWALAVMGIFWGSRAIVGFPIFEALNWSPWSLLAFAPLICVLTLLSNSTSVPGGRCYFLFTSLWCFCFVFLFPSLDLQIHQMQWYAAVWQLSPGTLLCLCTRRTYVPYFSHLSWMFELWKASYQESLNVELQKQGFCEGLNFDFYKTVLVWEVLAELEAVGGL